MYNLLQQITEYFHEHLLAHMIIFVFACLLGYFTLRHRNKRAEKDLRSFHGGEMITFDCSLKGRVQPFPRHWKVGILTIANNTLTPTFSWCPRFGMRKKTINLRQFTIKGITLKRPRLFEGLVVNTSFPIVEVKLNATTITMVIGVFTPQSVTVVEMVLPGFQKIYEQFYSDKDGEEAVRL